MNMRHGMIVLRSFTKLSLPRDYIYSLAIWTLNATINASFTAADAEAPLVVRHSSCINRLMTMASGRQPDSMQTMTVKNDCSASRKIAVSFW